MRVAAVHASAHQPLRLANPAWFAAVRYSAVASCYGWLSRKPPYNVKMQTNAVDWSNFGGPVLGCIDASDSERRLI